MELKSRRQVECDMKRFESKFGRWMGAACLLALLVAAPRAANARTQLRNICTVYGQKETPVIGIGLVVGLARTGDGGKNPAAMRALAATLRYLNNPIQTEKELSDTTNVAMVAISAT